MSHTSLLRSPLFRRGLPASAALVCLAALSSAQTFEFRTRTEYPQSATPPSDGAGASALPMPGGLGGNAAQRGGKGKKGKGGGAAVRHGGGGKASAQPSLPSALDAWS